MKKTKANVTIRDIIIGIVAYLLSYFGILDLTGPLTTIGQATFN